MYTVTDEITNSEDVIDSREIIARIDELQDEADRLENEASEAKEADDPNQDDIDKAEAAVVEFAESDECRELRNLKALQEELEGYCEDWRYGVTLIRYSYFETYAQELAEDIGAIDKNAMWPNTCIDWERACKELKYDYTSADFDGVEYWAR